MTWYPQEFVKTPMKNMKMHPNHHTGYPGRTYRFNTGKKVFEFGQGLSYSRYSYKFSSTTIKKIDLNVKIEHVEALGNRGKVHVRVENTPCRKLKFRFSIFVWNHDEMDGRHAVLLYSKSPATHKGTPQKQLIGFEVFMSYVNAQPKLHLLLSLVTTSALLKRMGKTFWPLVPIP